MNAEEREKRDRMGLTTTPYHPVTDRRLTGTGLCGHMSIQHGYYIDKETGVKYIRFEPVFGSPAEFIEHDWTCSECETGE